MTNLAESIRINYGICTTCGACVNACPNNIIRRDADASPVVFPGPDCISCGHCIAICPSGAMTIPQEMEEAGFADPAILACHLRSRRSIRLWKDRPVTNEECEELIKITAHAPSGCNIHPVKRVVVNDPENVKAFVAASTKHLRTVPKGNPMYGLALGLLRKLDAGNDILCRNAPALLIAVTKPDEDSGLVDSIIALTYADVYAPSIGLGTCWAGFVMILLSVFPQLYNILGIPEGYTAQFALLAGHPLYAFTRIPPREMPEIIWT